MSGTDELGRPFVDGIIDPGHVGGEALYEVYSNPLPHVLILTAIVVGVATTAVGLALAVRINEAYGSIEDDLLIEAEDVVDAEGAFQDRSPDSNRADGTGSDGSRS